jgi:hypothetical protein
MILMKADQTNVSKYIISLAVLHHLRNDISEVTQ